jgi:serine/threonine-protein kinase
MQYVPPEYQPQPSVPARGRDPRLLMVVIGCVAALAVAAGAAVFAIQHVSHASGRGVAAPAASSAAAVPPAAPAVTFTEPSTATETTEPTTETPATPTDEASAQAALAQQAAADHDQVEQLVGQWVPQLSSKKLGLVANGTTYDYQQIWADYQQLAQRYPGALLLRSSDYTSFKYTDFWITVVPQTFSTPDGANAWCDSQNIDANDCFAKKLMHTGGYAGTTVFRN